VRSLGVIPARGGSKGIPRKNLRSLAGRPVIAYSIAGARQCRELDRLIVSTDDAEIADTSRQLGAEVRMRPAQLGADDTPTRDVLHHLVIELAGEGYAPDAVVTLQPTSPLRTARHIAEALSLFAADPQADSLVSVVEVPHIFRPQSLMRLGPDGYLSPYLEGPIVTRRQDKETVFARNGAAIYITRTVRLAEYVFGGRLIPYRMDLDSSVDIDTIDDLALAERLLQKRG
jgi:CMP-N-acetylneuraminic acid synthetase